MIVPVSEPEVEVPVIFTVNVLLAPTAIDIGLPPDGVPPSPVKLRSMVNFVGVVAVIPVMRRVSWPLFVMVTVFSCDAKVNDVVKLKLVGDTDACALRTPTLPFTVIVFEAVVPITSVMALITILPLALPSVVAAVIVTSKYFVVPGAIITGLPQMV